MENEKTRIAQIVELMEELSCEDLNEVQLHAKELKAYKRRWEYINIEKK